MNNNNNYRNKIHDIGYNEHATLFFSSDFLAGKTFYDFISILARLLVKHKLL